MISSALRQAVNSYRMSETAQHLLKQTRILLIASVSGGGKNTVVQELQKSGDFHPLVSHTTRPKRQNKGVWEVNGREYWFVSEEQMLVKLQKGEMVEAKSIYDRQVSGVSIDELVKAHQEGKIAVGEVDVQGIEEIRRKKEDVVAVFLLPPSMSVWKQRLMERGMDFDSPEMQARLNTAQHELARAISDDFLKFVVNDNLQTAVAKTKAIAEGEQPQVAHREVAVNLFRDLSQLLKNKN